MSKMFPFNKSCEFSFQVSGKPEGQHDGVVDKDLLAAINLYMATAGADSTATAAARTATEGGRKRLAGGRVRVPKPHGGLAGCDEEMKKIVHRDTERQRRDVMAAHLSTLRSLLPLEVVQGKRSVSDHIAESVNYIKHLQKNIKELQDKRDRQRSLLHKTPFPPHVTDQDRSTSNNAPVNVDIFFNNGGLEVQIGGGERRGWVPLSEALTVLLQEGLSVICSISNRSNGIFVHNIQCQLSDSVDLQRVQQRLFDVVCSNSSYSSVFAH